jgi:hypothetical protein
MSTGNYGIIRGSTVEPSDVEVIWFYQPTRDYQGNIAVNRLVSTDVLSAVKDPLSNRVLGGAYNLKLPAASFNQKGFYYMILRPKQIETTIADIGILNGFENMVGIVFNVNAVPNPDDKVKFRDGGLTGFRVEYVNISDNTILPNFFRIITSSNLCEGVDSSVPTPNSLPAVRYRFNTSGSLLFCTVTPSSPHSSQPSVLPYIGQQSQTVILSSTYFDPIMMEIELTEHDSDTLAIALYGDQIKRVSDGNLTFYDRNRNIYKQFNIWEYQNPANAPLYQIRQKRDNVDVSMDFTRIVSANQS